MEAFANRACIHPWRVAIAFGAKMENAAAYKAA